MDDKSFLQNKLNEQIEILKHSQNSITEKEEKLLKNILEINGLHEKIASLNKEIESFSIEKAINEATQRENILIKDEKMQELLIKINRLEGEIAKKPSLKPIKEENHSIVFEKFKQEISVLKEEKTRNQKLLEQMRETISLKEQKIEDLLNERQRVLEKYQEKLGENAVKGEISKEFELRIRQMEGVIERKDGDLEKKRVEIEDFKQEKERIKLENDRFKQENDRFKLENDRFKLENDKIKLENNQIQIEIKEIQEKFQGDQEKIQRDSSQEFLKKEEEFIKKIEELEGELVNYKQNIEISNKKAELLTNSLNENITKIEKYEKALLRLNQEKKNLKKLNEEFRETIEKIQVFFLRISF